MINMQRPSAPVDTAILVVSCDKFEDLWRPFFTCLFKYWPDCPYPIHLGCNFAAYPDPRVRSIRIGRDVDYSTNLLRMLDAIDEEWVIVWVEDRLLSARVDTDRLANLVRVAEQEAAGYIKLLANHPFADSSTIDSGFGEISRAARYRACMTVGLWRKSVLKQLLRPGESAWDFERFGTVRSRDLTSKFLALSFTQRNDPPIADVHLVIKGRLIRDARPFIDAEQLQVCSMLRRRPLQTLRSHWYVKSYVAALDARAWLKTSWRGVDHPKRAWKRAT